MKKSPHIRLVEDVSDIIRLCDEAKSQAYLRDYEACLLTLREVRQNLRESIDLAEDNLQLLLMKVATGL